MRNGIRQVRPWNKDAFFRWLKIQMDQASPPIPNFSQLAELVDVSHSAISNWQNDKQRPTPDKLSLLADFFSTPRVDLWELAGVLDGGGHAQPVPERPEDPNITMIRDSKLPRAAQDKLIETYRKERAAREERQRQEDEAERARLEEQVQLMESLTVPPASE